MNDHDKIILQKIDPKQGAGSKNRLRTLIFMCFVILLIGVDLKADQNTRDVPVIFISAIHEVEEEVKAFSFGSVDYITKPFQEQEVLARVETHLKLRRFQTLLEEKNQQLQQEINDRKLAEGYLFRIMKAVQGTSDAIYLRSLGESFLSKQGLCRFI